MEQAEKELRYEIYNLNQKQQIKKRTKLFLDNEPDKENIFENNLKVFEHSDKPGQKEVINNFTNPTKEILYKLIDGITHQKEKDYDTSQTSLNKKILEAVKENLYLLEQNQKLSDYSKNIATETNELRNKIKDIKTAINKCVDETNYYIAKMKEKKDKENGEIANLKDQLDSIKYEQGKVEKERNEIIREYEDKKHILQKKDEELLKLKKKNLNLSEKIKYYSEGIKYHNQLHNDIQPYKNQMNNEYQEAKGNVRVFCRIRPPLQREISKKQIDIEYRGDNSLIIKGEKKASNVGREGGHQDVEQFQFNRIFKQNDTQEDVFEEVSSLIQSSLDGFNINIFAYGQTGSGKTFTMEGDTSSPLRYGIVPRSVDRIFRYFEEELKNMGWEIKFYLSVCEIYNKKTRDLLGEKNVDKTEELKEMEIHNLNEWNSNFSQIAQRRKVAETKMNMESSRSHLIFKIKIHLRNSNGLEDDRFGSLNLIDLAGSERVDKATVSEERFKESIEINSSLTHLKSVFEAMKSKHDKFVPFHNTPLTDVLKDCLSGDNSKTLMFVNISPLLDSFKESICSLKFATDVNKCYVSGNDNDTDEDDFEGFEKSSDLMDLDI